MKVFIDTNILMDVLIKRENLYPSSLGVLRYCQKYDCGYLNVLSIMNIAYLLKKYYTQENTNYFVGRIMDTYHCLDLTERDIVKAQKSNFKDFEDGVQNYSAENNYMDCIVTRNTKDYQSSKLNVFTPEEFIQNVYQYNLK